MLTVEQNIRLISNDRFKINPSLPVNFCNFVSNIALHNVDYSQQVCNVRQSALYQHVFSMCCLRLRDPAEKLRSKNQFDQQIVVVVLLFWGRQFTQNLLKSGH